MNRFSRLGDSLENIFAERKVRNTFLYSGNITFTDESLEAKQELDRRVLLPQRRQADVGYLRA